MRAGREEEKQGHKCGRHEGQPAARRQRAGVTARAVATAAGKMIVAERSFRHFRSDGRYSGRRRCRSFDGAGLTGPIVGVSMPGMRLNVAALSRQLPDGGIFRGVLPVAGRRQDFHGAGAVRHGAVSLQGEHGHHQPAHQQFEQSKHEAVESEHKARR